MLVDKADIGYMYKIVSNSNILKFPVTLRESFNVEKDEVKFGFNLHIESRRSATQTLKMKVPVMINTGKLKINNTGGNISSAQSVASGKVNPKMQEQKLKDGKAQMLDMSFVSSATEKQKLDESFQSNVTRMTAGSQMSQKQKEEQLLA